MYNEKNRKKYNRATDNRNLLVGVVYIVLKSLMCLLAMMIMMLMVDAQLAVARLQSYCRMLPFRRAMNVARKGVLRIQVRITGLT